jgi:signal transduction histidine kinase
LLLLVFGLAFVVALNLALRLNSDDTTFEPVGDFILWEETDLRDGRVLQSFRPVQVMRGVEDQVNQENLERLQNFSIIGVIGLFVASGIGGYFISGAMLRPVQRIQEVARSISEENLDARINYQGADDELRRLADTFDSMLDRLQVSFERQRQFVGDASHELRTPLTAIQTNIDVIEMDDAATLEDYKQLTTVIKDATTRMSRLSEDLLLLSSGGLDQKLAPCPLGGLTVETVEALRPIAALRGITLHVEAPASARALAHESRLQRVVTNLVENAIKYGVDGGNVWVRVKGGQHPRIEVADDGPGIPPEMRSRVFERFVRIDKSRARKAGGSGLGLAIVRQLVEEMGGSVALTDTPDGGATFIVQLKAVPAVERQRAASPTPAVREANVPAHG